MWYRSEVVMLLCMILTDSVCHSPLIHWPMHRILMVSSISRLCRLIALFGGKEHWSVGCLCLSCHWLWWSRHFIIILLLPLLLLVYYLGRLKHTKDIWTGMNAVGEENTAIPWSQRCKLHYFTNCCFDIRNNNVFLSTNSKNGTGIPIHPVTHC